LSSKQFGEYKREPTSSRANEAIREDSCPKGRRYNQHIGPLSLFLWVVSPTEGAKKIGVGIGGKLERSWDGI